MEVAMMPSLDIDVWELLVVIIIQNVVFADRYKGIIINGSGLTLFVDVAVADVPRVVIDTPFRIIRLIEGYYDQRTVDDIEGIGDGIRHANPNDVWSKVMNGFSLIMGPFRKLIVSSFLITIHEERVERNILFFRSVFRKTILVLNTI